MNTTIEATIHFATERRGRKAIRTVPPVLLPIGRVPRIAKLMALAIRFEGLVRSGQVRDYSELARLGHVTRARITQIMNLLLLAPDIQEELLFLPRIERGRDVLVQRKLQAIAAEADWGTQREMWVGLRQLVAG
jgi:hypothetical protein